MSNLSARTLEGIWAAWRRRDKAGTLSFFAGDAIFGQNIPQDVCPFGGISVGKPALSDRMQMILDQFEIVTCTGMVVGVDHDIARGQVAFHYRHKITSLDLESSMRMIIKLRGGLVVSLDEFHDVDKWRAFMRMISDRGGR